MHPSRYASATAEWPAYARIALACQLSGLSRSGIYRGIQAGHLRAVKHASTTLIDMTSIRQFLDGLPAAVIRNAA